MRNYNRDKIIIICLLLGLCACNSQPVKETVSQIDASEVERIADHAYENQDWLSSERHYVQLVQDPPVKASHWFRLGNIYAKTRRADAAMVAYREALRLDPKLSKAWFNMGILQLKQAAKSFDHLQSQADEKDPLHSRGRDIFSGIIELIK
jgi:cytochrome c-type biogenesis protein CcmH/NrfG